mmetsp:Transcript_32783/g.74910  ORF Transcript_32783/g.74910 Transcript_32783/m.74910 type:complete len:399 (+) Transcript_32783:88-1284(+)
MAPPPILETMVSTHSHTDAARGTALPALEDNGLAPLADVANTTPEVGGPAPSRRRVVVAKSAMRGDAATGDQSRASSAGGSPAKLRRVILKESPPMTLNMAQRPSKVPRVALLAMAKAPREHTGNGESSAPVTSSRREAHKSDSRVPPRVLPFNLGAHRVAGGAGAEKAEEKDAVVELHSARHFFARRGSWVQRLEKKALPVRRHHRPDPRVPRPHSDRVPRATKVSTGARPVSEEVVKRSEPPSEEVSVLADADAQHLAADAKTDEDFKERITAVSDMLGGLNLQVCLKCSSMFTPKFIPECGHDVGLCCRCLGRKTGRTLLESVDMELACDVCEKAMTHSDLVKLGDKLCMHIPTAALDKLRLHLRTLEKKWFMHRLPRLRRRVPPAPKGGSPRAH